MTAGELIELLKQENPNRLVVMASDSEGNHYSPLAGYWLGSYLAEKPWRGEAGLEALTPEDKAAGYSEEDVVDGVPALILTPSN